MVKRKITVSQLFDESYTNNEPKSSKSYKF